jgi:putative membrane protein
MKIFSQILFVARIEIGLFWRYPKLLVATLAVMLVPAAYSLIYLRSVWNPDAHTHSLAVAVVNLDQGTIFHGQHFNVGNEIVASLQKQKQFRFRPYADEQLVRQRVRQGYLTFALIIPADFSDNAIPGRLKTASQPIIVVSEGNNYEGAAIAKHFSETLGHQISKTLNERRWALTLDTAAVLRQQVAELRAGVTQLKVGAQKLSHGANETSRGARTLSEGNSLLTSGLGQLTTGVKQFRQGLQTVGQSLPSDADLFRLKTGAQKLASGQNELVHGIQALKDGTDQLNTGIVSFRKEANDSLFIPSSVVTSADELANGISRIGNGLGSAWIAQQQLFSGANTLSRGVGELTDGVSALRHGLQSAAVQLPDESQLDRLSNGARDVSNGSVRIFNATAQLANGSNRLAGGLEKLEDALPREIQTLEGNPAGLAESVQPRIQVAAAVKNTGAGFAPNIISGALWLGGGVAAFLLHIRILPSQARPFPPLAKYLGKILLPTCVVCVQAMLVFLTVRFLLRIPIYDPYCFGVALCLSALSFLFIIFALARSFGDAGKGFAMVLLAIQFASSGGILPVELSGRVFVDISPWLPMTWAIRALRATMFNAFDGVWRTPALFLCIAGLLLTLLGCLIGRWRFTHPEHLSPAVDF